MACEFPVNEHFWDRSSCAPFYCQLFTVTNAAVVVTLKIIVMDDQLLCMLQYSKKSNDESSLANRIFAESHRNITNGK